MFSLCLLSGRRSSSSSGGRLGQESERGLHTRGDCGKLLPEGAEERLSRAARFQQLGSRRKQQQNRTHKPLCIIQYFLKCSEKTGVIEVLSHRADGLGTTLGPAFPKC